MTDPIGRDTYNGLGVPLHGDSVIRQRNSSNAILTLMHSTLNTGRLLMGMDNSASSNQANPQISSLVDRAVFDIDADGGFRSVSGTTVKMELNSSGLFFGSEMLINADGGVKFQQHSNIVTISSDGTSAYTLLAANAGKMHVVSTEIATSIVVSLPTSAAGLGMIPGMYWDIFHNSTAAGVLDVTLVGDNTGGSILCHHTTNAIATTGAITHDSSGPVWMRVMVDTTGADPVYVFSNFLGINGATTAAYGGGFTAGSTALTP